MKRLISKAPILAAVMGLGLVFGMSSFTKSPGDIVTLIGGQYVNVSANYFCDGTSGSCTSKVNAGVSHGAPYLATEVTAFQSGTYNP